MPPKGQNSKKGKSFEDLVEKLEKLLATGDIKIERNVKLPNKGFDGYREIDILLTAKMGVYEFKVIIECRDRRKTSDISWIGDLVFKRDSVGANHVVAVSASKFSRPVIQAARKNHITLRNLDYISIVDIADWFKISNVQVAKSKVQVLRATLDSLNGESLSSEAKAIIASHVESTNNSLFFDPKTQKSFSLEALWAEYIALHPNTVGDWGDKLLAQGLTSSIENVVLPIADVLEIPSINMPEFKVKYIHLQLGFMLEFFSLPAKQALKYLEGDRALAHSVRFEKEIDGMVFSIDVTQVDEKIDVNIVSPLDIRPNVQNKKSN